MTRSHEQYKDENQINIHVLVWKSSFIGLSIPCPKNFKQINETMSLSEIPKRLKMKFIRRKQINMTQWQKFYGDLTIIMSAVN